MTSVSVSFLKRRGSPVIASARILRSILLMPGDRAEQDRACRRPRREGEILGNRLARRLADEAGEDRGAISPLAASHSGARQALQPADGRRFVGKRVADPLQRHMLAATD